MKRIPLNLNAQEILNDPMTNKGTAFTLEERDELGLHGFLPFHISTLEEQVKRRYQNFQEKPSQLLKYGFLSSLENRNQILFYRLVSEHITEMLPLIYTPTIGDVSLDFSAIYHHSHGVYLSYPLKDKIKEIIANIPQQELDVIVVTDGERILGLGDVGIGGMAIPQGKLALYSLFGGIHPRRTLPIMLDMGTNNETLLKDPLYLGWRHPRITGEEYDSFIEAFITAFKERFPKTLVQWEDFAKQNARPLLERYQDRICSFNDDIQGTAAVALSAIQTAAKITGSKLTDQRIVLFGGGSAGLGIAHLVIEALKLEGMSEIEALRSFYVVDIGGLLHQNMQNLDPAQTPFARPFDEVSTWHSQSPLITLLDTIKHAKPTVLIGVSAQSQMFTEEIIRLMAANTKRPIIFPLSNPTSRAEARPEDLIRWTEGRGIIATGSPCLPIDYEGRKYAISQCNNVYIFPGVGLGVVACKSPKVTERMFIRAAQVLSEHTPSIQNEAVLFPPLEQLRSISRQIAIEVVLVAQEQGLVPKSSLPEIKDQVDQVMWKAEYPIYYRQK